MVATAKTTQTPLILSTGPAESCSTHRTGSTWSPTGLKVTQHKTRILSSNVVMPYYRYNTFTAFNKDPFVNALILTFLNRYPMLIER